jgi:hypothetical protein
MLVSFRVPEVTESPIIEVFPYEREDEELLPPPPSNLKPLSEVKAEQDRREEARAAINMAEESNFNDEEEAELREYKEGAE